MSTVRIPGRYNGPPSSGHGGYSAGVFAAQLDEQPAAVSLRAPPPLDTDLQVVRAGAGLEIRDGSALVATVEPATPVEEPPAALTPGEAAAAALGPEAALEGHPFPTCYGCGPLRDDGLRLFAGRDHGEHACAWTPRDTAFEQIWAALDCPSGSPAMTGAPIVLARFCVAIEGPVTAGEPHAIVARKAREDGRKTFTAVALFDAEGRRLARGDALWIRLE